MLWLVKMPTIQMNEIWNSNISSEDSQIEINKGTKKTEREEFKPTQHQQVIPISYSQLQNYGYAIFSEKHAAFVDDSSDALLASEYFIDKTDRKLTYVEQNILQISRLVNKPSFLKIYIIKDSSSSVNSAFCQLVSERFGKRKVVWKGKINLKM